MTMIHFTKSLRFKVTLLVIMVELLIFSAVGVFYTHRFSQEIDNAIIARLSIPGLLMTRGELSFDAVSDKRTMEGLLHEPYSEGIVIGLDGHVYFSSNPARLDRHLDEIDGLRLPGPESSTFSVDAPDLITPVQDSTGIYLTCLSPLRPNGKLTGYLYLKVGTGISEAEKRKVSILFAIGSLATIALTAAILSWLLHLMVIRRLNYLVEIFHRFALGDYAARAQPLGGDDEIATLMNGFNGLAKRLEVTVAHLSESESRFRVLVERAPEAILVYDVDTKHFVDANQNAERLFACSREQLRLASSTTLYAPVQTDKMPAEQGVDEYLRRALAGEEVVVERAITNARGQQLLCEVRLVLLPASDSRLIRASYLDITERKLAEEELRRLTLFQRTILDNAAYGIVSASPDGIVSSFNHAAERLLGYTADEVVGKLTPECWHDPEEIARRALQLSEELGETILPGFDVFTARPRRNLPEENEWTFISKDGTRVPVLLSVTALRGESGQITGFVGLTYDLTERKLAEEALHRLNRELRAISNCNQVLIRAEDEQTLLSEICRIICDEAGYRMAWVGYAENDDARTIRPVAWAGAEDGYLEQAGLTWADTEQGCGPAGTAIRSGESACIQDFTTDPQAAPWRESALQRGYRSSISLPLKDECANTFGILNIYSTEPNAFTPDEIRLLEELAGDLAFGIMVLRTRIERKQAEEALTHLAAIVESSEDAIIGKSPEGIILSWNRGAERLYGYREEEVKRRSVSILIPDDHAGEMSYILDHVKRGQPLEHYETVRLRKDGSRVEVSVTVSPICDAGGKIVGASTIARDITELRKAELELQKLNEELERRIIERTADLNKRSAELSESQQALINIVEDLNDKADELEHANSRLQELDRLKSMFIASMSHELRTPLNSVIGFSSVLLNGWVGPINAEQKENLAIILRSGKHLLNLINDVIDVSKIEAGKIESVPEEFDLRDLIDDAVSLVKKELGEKGLVLRVTAASQLMFTDRRRLLQCVLNLLSNAVKFTGQGGVTVETRIVQSPGATLEAGVAEISVTDSGIGIREEEIGKMFQPFVRLFSPLQSTVPGTGLGLYLTRKLAAEVLKGDILLTSEYGKGSRFTIKIPVRMP